MNTSDLHPRQTLPGALLLTGVPLAARPTVSRRLLPALLSLLMLHWWAVSPAPLAADTLADGMPGAGIARPAAPVVLAAAPKTIAAKPRGSERTKPPILGGNIAVLRAPFDPVDPAARMRFGRAFDLNHVLVLIRPFDVRGPPTA